MKTSMLAIASGTIITTSVAFSRSGANGWLREPGSNDSSAQVADLGIQPPPTATATPTASPSPLPLDAKLRFNWTLVQVKCGSEESSVFSSPVSSLSISDTYNTGSRSWAIDQCSHSASLSNLTSTGSSGTGSLTGDITSPSCSSVNPTVYCAPIAALCEGREPTTYGYVVSGIDEKTLTLTADFSGEGFAPAPCGSGQDHTNVQFIYTRP